MITMKIYVVSRLIVIIILNYILSIAEDIKFK
jgi:hypothetical protein